MESLRIDTGVIRLQINDGPGYIEFNPASVQFAQRFYALIGDFESKLEEYETRSAAIEANTETDKNGLPVNMPERLALLEETCNYIRAKIDDIFGAGTSQTAFGDDLNLDVFEQFLVGITPFVQRARSKKVEKYLK